MGFLGGSVVKNPPANQRRRWRRRWFHPSVAKIPWRRAQQPTPVFLPGESHGQRAWRATVHGFAEWEHDWATEHVQYTSIADGRLRLWNCFSCPSNSPSGFTNKLDADSFLAAGMWRVVSQITFEGLKKTFIDCPMDCSRPPPPPTHTPHPGVS